MKTVSRVLATGFAVATLSLTAAGVAGAAEQTPQNTPIWLIPGVDLGPLLDPTTGLPEALAPVFGLLSLIGA
ncbi:hypothetical protein SAMN05192558_10343 [Actinokineospora alba]|uniref:Uncharacterized protein n=1 Tax=Actinokineospora alba TaxID=504798 RepID=A0A1H0JD97_9PSEU|nr:hypothetical protein [Actinokineospora alba]TDP68334.1 hypothetical protein C8E96_3899 [Actinokineospora alba]SDH76931.1 hypothetical protein SAMN05421871_10210 [Actinokineospora alba]SDO41718.1 hypothetical protein SAMN05192558_10343 [Actinokineospora alba]